MKYLLFCLLACCLVGRAWAQQELPPACHIRELSRPFHVIESVTVAGASKATVVGRAMRWARKVTVPSAHPVDTATDGGTLRVSVEGRWPYRYTVAGKSQPASLHFVAELIPEDSTCWFTFSQLVLRTPSSSMSAEYLVRKDSPARTRMKPAELEALRTRLFDSLNALIAGLKIELNRTTAFKP